MVLPLITVPFLSIILFKLLSWMYAHLALKIKLIRIPGRLTLPFVGLFATVAIVPQKALFRLLWKASQSYKNGMFITWFGTHPRLYIRKPHQIEILLKSQTLITKADIYDYLTDWLGGGLLTSTGDTWHKSRRLVTPAFHFSILDQYAHVFHDKVNFLNSSIQALVEKGPEKPINIFPMVIKFTLDVVCKTVMGLDLDIQRKPENQYVQALNRFMKITAYRFCHPWLYPDVIFNLTSIGKQYRESIDKLHVFTMKVINEKMKTRAENAQNFSTIAKNTENIDKNKTTAFLDLLIDSSEVDENPLSLIEIREQVDTFMFGGHDTTGIAISYVLFCLGNAPEAQKKVHEEISEVVGNSHEPLTKQQLAQLKYIERVIKESMRLFPSIQNIGRSLEHDVVIDGHHLPKGLDVFMLVMQLHRDPEIWVDPGKFDPDRFLPENSVGRHPYAYLPFSAGPRNCVGQKYAMLLMKIAVVEIMKKWTVYSEADINDMRLTFELVLTPPNETINLRFERRY